MRNLILDLLDFTKIESGKHDREAVDTDIIPVIMTAIDTMKPYSIQKDIKVDLDTPEHIYIKTDADDLEIVFNNLISNAIKYNNTGGSVKCSIKESEKEISIRISDTGIGMKDEEISKLFNEFYRIRNEKTKNISGSGLGLSIVKKIIDYYHGNIAVESIPDEGTSFIINLPK
jgi:two-component system, sensor histidine kinase and response regulator